MRQNKITMPLSIADNCNIFHQQTSSSFNLPKFNKFPKSAGISPVREFLSRRRRSRLLNAPNTGGICPLSSFPWTFRKPIEKRGKKIHCLNAVRCRLMYFNPSEWIDWLC